MGLGARLAGVILWIAAVLLLTIAVPAAAGTTGQLRVTVVDDADELPIADVTLRLSGETLIGGVQERDTDANGVALFVELPPGVYRLVAERDGFRGLTIEGILTKLGRTTVQTVRLRTRHTEEATVRTFSGAMNTDSMSTGAELTKEFVRNIPAGRSYETAVQLAPDAMVDGGVASAPAPTAPPMPPLKAGTTDDNAEFDAYLAFYREWSDRTEIAGHTLPLEVRDRRWIDVLDPNGRPVVAAEVHVVDRARDEVVWVATTAGDGRVPFYPWLDGPAADPTDGYTVVVDGVPYEKRWTGAQNLEIVVDREQVIPEIVPVDVVLILDTTASMGDELARVQSTLLRVTGRLGELDRRADIRVGLVRYRDRGDAYVTRVTPLTSDVAALDHVLRETDAGGGGDDPESLNAGLAAAVGLGFRPEAAKVAFLIADAPPHLDYRNDTPYTASVRTAVELGLKVHMVAASGLDGAGSLIFRQIAQFTRGKFVFVEYGGDVAASGAAHGVEGQLASNNLDAILFDLVRLEVEGYGR